MKGKIILQPIKDFSPSLRYITRDLKDYLGDGYEEGIYRLGIEYVTHEDLYQPNGLHIVTEMQFVPLRSDCWDRAIEDGYVNKEVDFTLQFMDDDDSPFDGRHPSQVAVIT